jgi:hypothetical protein
MRSTAFYERFGFEVRNTYEMDRPACLVLAGAPPGADMLAEADAPVIASEQAVFFYVYLHEELHTSLAEAGLEPGPIESGAPGPDRQFGISDPDGYLVMVTDAAAVEPRSRAE